MLCIFYVITGLLHPRASSAAPAIAPIPINASSASTYTSTPPTNPHSGNKVRRSESMSRMERRPMKPNGALVSHPGHIVQSQEFHNYSPNATYQRIGGATQNNTLVHHNNGHMMSNGLELGTLSLNKTSTGAHLVNGKLYAAKQGYIINSNGQVVNLTDGEVMTIAQGERLNIIHRLPDTDHQSGHSYVPASNLMFNRVGFQLHTARLSINIKL